MSDLSAPPPLSPVLSSLYSSMNYESQRLFIKVFKYLWDYILKRRKNYDVVHLYWCLDAIRLKYDLTTAQLSFLTYIYHLSERGTCIINSVKLQRCSSLALAPTTISDLTRHFKDLGYLIRMSRDPSAPYLQRSVSRTKIFIQLTGKCIAFIDSVDSDLRNMLVNTTIDEVTTGHAKG